MTSEVNLEKSAPSGADNVRKSFLTISTRNVKLASLAFILGAGLTSALLDDSEDTRRREWTSACVTTIGGASGKVGELSARGAYVAFLDGARVWYPMDELEKSDCVELFPDVLESAPTPSTELEDAAQANRDIMKTRKEIEMLTLRLEQARLARELYNTMQSEADTAKP